MRLLLTIAALPLATACHASWEGGDRVAPSGAGAERSYPAKGFTAVELRGPDDVDVQTGGAFAVRAEGDPKALDLLEIRVDGDKLKVGRKDHKGWFESDRGVKVHVVMPRLSAASVAGSGNLRVDRAEGDTIDAAVGGSGSLYIAAAKAHKLTLSIAGSGDLSAAGTVDSIDASIAGSGSIKAGNLTAGAADVSIAGSGDVRATVHGNAAVSILGSGSAILGGGTRCSVRKLGSGEARCS